MRRIALSALISLRQARSLSIVQRGAYHAVVRGVLDRSDVDAIRRQAGQSVAVSTDGVKWSEVFATDTNVLSSVSIQLGSISASRVRVVMHEVRFLVLCCCFATWLALVAGISVLPRSCSVWH